MESSETAGEHPLTKLEIQLDLIGGAFGETFGKQLFGDGTLDYLYVRGVILVRDAYLAEVARLLEDEDEPDERGQEFARVEGLLPGVSLVSVGNRDIPRLLDKIDASLGVGVATPDHILSVTPVWACPASEPEGVPSGSPPYPGECTGSGAGAHIYVADTGLLTGPAPPTRGSPGSPAPRIRCTTRAGRRSSRTTRATARSSPGSPAAWRRPRGWR